MWVDRCCCEQLCTSICVNICFISLGHIPRSGIAGHVVALFLTLWGSTRLFYTAVVSFNIPED